MAYGWVITKDVIDNGKANDTSGGSLPTEQVRKEGKRFRMLDDDDEIYYYGKMVEGDDAEGFEPLDDFGMPNSGCTSIEYRNDAGHWEPL